MKSHEHHSWLWRWVANNKVVSVLVIILLMLSIIFMLYQVRFIFQPLGEFTSAVGAPIALAGVLYFLFNPLIDWFQNRWHWPRILTIIALFVFVALLIVVGFMVGIPWIRGQITVFLQHWPEYWERMINIVDRWSQDEHLKQLNAWLNETNYNLTRWASEHSSNFATSGLAHLGTLVGTVTTIIVTILTFPFILFYLLKDGHRLPGYMANFLPPKARPSFLDTVHEITKQISNYIRGQLLVALAVAIIFTIGYTIIGLPFGWIIAIAAGVLNLIPFLGSFLAMIPAYVVALFVSPKMIILVTIVFVIEQTLEGRLITPKLLGDSLKVHPVTVLVVLLSAGNIFGLLGVVFGIPGYAIAKVLVTRSYAWWKNSSALFNEPVDEEN